MDVRALSLAVLAALAGGAAAPAVAKEIPPGGLRVCGADRCAGVDERNARLAFYRFLYLGARPARAPSPRLGAPTYRLRFSNGYTVGIVSGERLDRFLSYGVYLERFRRARWYRLAPRAAAEVRRHAARLEPVLLTREAVARSR